MARHRLLGVAVLVLCVIAASANTVENQHKEELSANKSSNVASSMPTEAIIPVPARQRPASSIAHHKSAQQAEDSAGPSQGSTPAVNGAVLTAQQGVDVPFPPLMPSSGEPMPRLSRDIRGLPISITNGRLNPSTFSPQGMGTSDISAFTFQSDLLCSGTQLRSRIGVCYLSASMLPQGVQTTHSALATTMCVMEQAAPDCDPQLSSGLTLSASGMLTVVTNGTAVPAVNQFFATTPLIIDGVYSSSRADTLLSSLIKFKSGNIDIRSVVRRRVGTAAVYTGSIILNLFKGGPLA